MAKRRGPDGVPVASVKHDDNDKAADADASLDFGDNKDTRLGGDQPALAADSPGSGERPASLFPDDPPTAPPQKAQQPLEDPPTIIGRTRRQRHKGSAASGAQPEPAASRAMDDPVAGWLVIIKGPGQGEYLKVGYGQNSIGRSPNERITLDFGDSQIARNSHAILTYDPRGNAFYIQQGAGSRPAYLNAAPLLSPGALAPLGHITLGETTLRFVPFCGKDFTWESFEEDT